MDGWKDGRKSGRKCIPMNKARISKRISDVVDNASGAFVRYTSQFFVGYSNKSSSWFSSAFSSQ
jgi:hypothetical protein